MGSAIDAMQQEVHVPECVVSCSTLSGILTVTTQLGHGRRRTLPYLQLQVPQLENSSCSSP